MVDVSILRRAPEDRIRTVPMFGGDASVKVRYCGQDEMKRIRDVAAELVKQGTTPEDAYNIAYGRVALLGWSGFVDGNLPFEFNQENIDLLMQGSTEVRTVVITASSSLKAGAEKN